MITISETTLYISGLVSACLGVVLGVIITRLWMKR